MGIVFDIQRMSVHDGPGIRTTIFLKGCSLRCKWCHNPESYLTSVQLQFTDEKCILCGKCVNICHKNIHQISGNSHKVAFNQCDACGKCVDVCPSTALEMMGKSMTVEQIYREVEKDDVFFGDDGGVTFSGGEVLVQIDFLEALLCRGKELGYHICVDTTGHAPFSSLERIIPYTDAFLYDVKAITPEIHKAGTGVDNGWILENLKKLSDLKQTIYIRIPLIKEYNGTEAEVTRMADFLQPLNIEGVTLMPYHVLGKSKRSMVGLPAGDNLTAPSKEEMDAFRQIFLDRNITLI